MHTWLPTFDKALYVRVLYAYVGNVGKFKQITIGSQKKILIIDKFDIAGGIFKIACIDNYLLDYRSLYPIGKLGNAVGK